MDDFHRFPHIFLSEDDFTVPLFWTLKFLFATTGLLERSLSQEDFGSSSRNAFY